MCIKSKKTLRNVFIGVLTMLLWLTCFVSIKTLDAAKAATAIAAPQNLKVDALGILRWDEASGAEGYEWSYSTDGGASYSSAASSVGTEADVSVAVSKAVEAAQAKNATSAALKLKVKSLPEGGESVIDYAPTQYINFGYSQHDIADVYAPAAAEGGKVGNTAFMAHSVLYTNELMTFGLSFSVEEEKYYRFGILNDGTSANWEYYYYDFAIVNTGKVTSNRQKTNSWNYTFPAMAANETSYFAVGVFDTYSVEDGAWIGETVYMNRTDIVNGKPVVVGTLARFFDIRLSATSGANFHLTYDRPSHLTNAKNHTAVNNATIGENGTATGTVPKDTFGLLSSSDAGVVLKSGRIPATSAAVSAPTQVFYDNVTEQVKWNRVEKATAYEWSYVGKTAWETVTTEYIPAEKVAAAIQAAKTSGEEYVRFAVRALNGSNKGHTAYYTLDLSAFYGASSTLKDISEINTKLQDPSAPLSDPLASAPTVYSYHNTGYGVNTLVEHAFSFNAPENNTNRLMIGVHANAWGKTTGYVFSIYQKGIITVGRNSTQGNGNNTYWFRPTPVAFEAGKTYVATYGVEALVNASGDKVADRITMRISEVEADGYRQVLTNLSYDNYEYDIEGVKIEKYSTIINYLLSGTDEFKATTKISCVNSPYEYQVTPVINGKALTEQMQTVTYGQEYDFTSVLETEGYELENAEWKYKLTPDGEAKTFYLKGYWNIHFDYEGQNVGGFYTQTELVDYDIRYDMGSVANVTNTENPTTYTFEDEITLKAPQVPQGYVFKGWYKNCEAGVYSNEVETIENSYGDITLYARIIRGYDVSVTIDSGSAQHNLLDEDSAGFTLPKLPNVYGKEFVGWYVKNNGAFEAYTGANSMQITSNMEFWAKYEYKSYAVTYNADGGKHSNAATYTTENVLVFAPAAKEGFFFDGWYTNPEFSGARVVDTDGFTDNITLYAKYIADEESRTVTYSLSEKIQKLPALELPAGATYTVKLYQEGSAEELDIIENVAYVFDKEGKYTLKYSVTLATGENLEREIVISVESLAIKVDGEYEKKYTVGDELTILDAYLPDGSKATVEVKKDGEVIELDGNTLVLEEGTYKIIYKDESGILESKTVSFEVGKSYVWPIVGVSLGIVAVLAIAAGITVPLVLKKKKSKKD